LQGKAAALNILVSSIITKRRGVFFKMSVAQKDRFRVTFSALRVAIG
jgi:hypothetical protein